MSAATAIKHHHHLTLCTGTAQEDYDFHTGLLGLKSVKKTALYDGTVPIYHLYYANDLGDESTIVTCFPMRQSGRVGRKGSGQVSAISLSVPASSLDFWRERFRAAGYPFTERERYGKLLTAALQRTLEAVVAAWGQELVELVVDRLGDRRHLQREREVLRDAEREGQIVLTLRAESRER